MATTMNNNPYSCMAWGGDSSSPADAYAAEAAPTNRWQGFGVFCRLMEDYLRDHPSEFYRSASTSGSDGVRSLDSGS